MGVALFVNKKDLTELENKIISLENQVARLENDIKRHERQIIEDRHDNSMIYVFKVKDYTTILVGFKTIKDGLNVYYTERGDGTKYYHYSNQVEFAFPIGSLGNYTLGSIKENDVAEQSLAVGEQK